MKSIAFKDLTATPWKNGGGVTRELACFPPGAGFGDFLWRVSIAEVNQSGAFSTFTGIDRIIALLDGDGMLLEFDDGKRHELTTPLMPFRFRGEDPLQAHLAGRPSVDFNLMLRRDAVDGEMSILRNTCSIDTPSETVLLFCAKGCWKASDANGAHHELTAQNALIAEGSMALQPLQADSVLICITIIRKTSHEN